MKKFVTILMLFFCSKTFSLDVWAEWDKCSDAFFLRGDANFDWSVNIADADAINAWLFLGGEKPCPIAADTNDDGELNISDSIYLLNFLFLGGPQPPFPYPNPSDNRMHCQWDKWNLGVCDPCFKRGDLDHDGEITQIDLVMLLRVINGLDIPSCWEPCDFNEDLEVTYADYDLMFDYVLNPWLFPPVIRKCACWARPGECSEFHCQMLP